MIIKRKWPWFAQQEWENILFIHWPVPSDEIEQLLPRSFKLDKFAQMAWIGFVLFRAKNSRLRGIPKLLSYPSFIQLNVRTYVKYGQERGVYFFSQDASRKLAVKGAKLCSLPFRQAMMSYQEKNDTFIFKSERTEKKTPFAKCEITYTPIKRLFPSKEEPLAFWFTERYCIWLKSKKGMIMKAPILHEHWKLKEVKYDISFEGLAPNTINKNHFQAAPIVHYSPHKKAFLYPFERDK